MAFNPPPPLMKLRPKDGTEVIMISYSKYTNERKDGHCT